MKYYGFSKKAVIEMLRTLLAVGGLGQHEEDALRAAIKFIEMGL